MIGLDTGAWIAFFAAAPGKDVELVGRAQVDNQERRLPDAGDCQDCGCKS